MQAKSKSYEEASLKIVQRQQQIAVLRKQLKAKDDEFLSMKEQLADQLVQKDDLKRFCLFTTNTNMDDMLCQTTECGRRSAATIRSLPREDWEGRQERRPTGSLTYHPSILSSYYSIIAYLIVIITIR